MKFAIVLALLGAALALRSPRFENRNIEESSFRNGREYRYRFNGQLSAGLPVPGSQQGITRFQTLATFQMIKEDTMRMRLDEFEFATSPEERFSRSMQPMSVFKKVDLEKENEELLSMPVEFYYEHGMISDIKFSDNDKPWSENIKRAVMNMLQVNILKKGHSEKFDDEEKGVNTFSTTERTIEGECEILYTMEDDSESQEQRWEKSINFEKCVRRPIMRNVRVPVCEDCKTTLDQEKMSQTVMMFNITGTPSQFLINSVELRSQHLFAPINEKEQLLSAFTINTMELVFAGEMKSQIKKVHGDKPVTLIYNNEHELAEEQWAQTGEEKYLRQMPAMWNNKVEIIEKMMALIAKKIEKEVDPEISHFTARVVDMLRMCNEEELNKIFRSVINLSEKNEVVGEHIRSLYFNFLTIAATRVTIRQFFEKVEERKYITPLRASMSLKSLVDMRFPSVKIAEDVLRFCESDIAVAHPYLSQACWLTYGAVVNGACMPTSRIYAGRDLNTQCPRETKLAIVRKLVEKFEYATDRSQKVLALKTMANTGLDTMIFDLEKIILNMDNEKTIRIQAVEALRRLKVVMPKKVQQVLMPVYRSRQQPHYLRMAALHQIMNTQPEWPVLSQIGQQLRQERSQQVRAFTLSLLRSYANSESPCERSIAKRVNTILQTVPFSSKQIESFESRYGKWSANWERHQSALDMTFGNIFTNESVLPTELMASLEGVYAGEWEQYFAQIGASQQNLEKLIRQVLNKVQENGWEKVVVRGKRASGSFRPTDLLNSLLQKLQITRRSPSYDEPHALVYFRFRDMDYAFLPIDAESIPETLRSMIQNGRIEIGDLERLLAQGIRFSTSSAAFFYESVRRVPTALGLPVMLNSKMPTVSTINGHFKFEIEPKNGKSFDGLRMTFVAHPKVASTHVLSLAVMTPFVQTGTKFLHQITLDTPIDLKVEMDWRTKTFNWKTFINTPTDERRVFMFHSRPVTFVRTMMTDDRQYPEPVEMTWMLPAHQARNHPIDRKYFQNSLVKVNVQGMFVQPVNPRIPQWIVENTIDVFVAPTKNTPEVIESTFNVDLFKPVQMEKPEIETYYRKSNRFMNYEDEDETEKMTEIERIMESWKRETTYKHRISFDIKDYVSAHLTNICSGKWRACKSRFELVDVQNTQPMNVHLDWYFPDVPRSLEELKDQKHKNLVIVGKWLWKKNMVDWKIEGQQSEEQKQWLEQLKETNTISDRLAQYAQLNQYQMIANYKLEKPMEKMIEKLWTMMDFKLQMQKPWARFVEIFDDVRDNQRIRAKLVIEPRFRQTMDLTVETPFTRTNFNQIDTPVTLPTVQIMETPSYKKHLLESPKSADCMVKSSKIETFDNVVYRNKFTPCYSVLAKDCGSEKPRFVVLMKEIKKNEEWKNLKVLYKDNEIEMDFNKEKMTVRLNGDKLEYDNEDMTVEKTGFTLFWINKDSIKFDSDEISVHFNGRTARIHLAATYRNQQCGLCGHYDNEKDSEFFAADNMEKHNIGEFAKSFLYQDDECDYEEEIFEKKVNFRREPEYEEESDEEYDREEKENAQPEEQILVTERQHEVCISTQPIARCPTESQMIIKSHKEEVEFNCFPSSNIWARRLVRDLRRNPMRQLSEERLAELEEQPRKTLRNLRIVVDEKCEMTY
ncbi:unnamed protein product [Caenorhabditis bovis]|uniref:Uncharacterized protein n=1 Tax=Caenorhabditis bovis TaxID=2654633 RepID=A0A8S1EUW6_9PELO|nr:unnamed protein product [Caenorhabditis bovis]